MARRECLPDETFWCPFLILSAWRGSILEHLKVLMNLLLVIHIDWAAECTRNKPPPAQNQSHNQSMVAWMNKDTCPGDGCTGLTLPCGNDHHSLCCRYCAHNWTCWKKNGVTRKLIFKYGDKTWWLAGYWCVLCCEGILTPALQQLEPCFPSSTCDYNGLCCVSMTRPLLNSS